RVAMAAKDWKEAKRHLESALAIVATFQIPGTAWRIHATSAELARCVKDDTAAEDHRARAEAAVVALADSFDREEPVRHACRCSPPVRQVLRGPGDGKRTATRAAKR